MRKIFFMLFVLSCLLLQAQNQAKVGNIPFGTVYSEALTVIKNEFGEPAIVSNTQVMYKNITFNGLKFSEVFLNFRNNKFIEARFFMNAITKTAAINMKELIAKTFGNSFDLSKDLEEDGSTFYKGGTGPFGVGHLFTIFSAPNHGAWSAQLRYGPFNY